MPNKKKTSTTDTKQKSNKKGIPHFLLIGSILYLLFLFVGWYLSSDVREGIIIVMNQQLGSF